MKKVLFLLASAALLFAGCAKEQAVESSASGETHTVSVRVALPESGTKAEADNDGNAAKANHWIMEVYDAQGALFLRDVKTPAEGTLVQTFNINLIKNQSYIFLFWADNNSGYYNTDKLTEVKLNLTSGAYVANTDARDAFSARKAYAPSDGTSISAELYRPFAQVNVITTDLVDLWKQAAKSGNQQATYEKFEPGSFKASISVPTSFNVNTQTCGEESTVVMAADKSYTGYKANMKVAREKNNYLRHINPATLYMDYIFAPKDESALKTINFEFVSNGNKIEHTFNNIPVQANYRTNIKGRLLSNEATVVVEIKPGWTSPDYEASAEADEED